MPEIKSTIRPGPKTLASFGNVEMPVTWGDHFETLENGGYLEPVFTSGSNMTATNGHIYVRAGSVLVLSGNKRWQVLNQSADSNSDGVADALASLATLVGVLKTTVDLVDGGGRVGIHISGGFFATRMPSVTDNAVAGLEATVKQGLRNRGFRFAEDYQ